MNMAYLDMFIDSSVLELERRFPQLKDSRNAIINKMYEVGWAYLRDHYCGVFEKDEEKLVSLMKESLIKLKNCVNVIYIEDFLIEEFAEYFSRFIGYCGTYLALLPEKNSKENISIKYFDEKMNEILFEVYNSN